jgi:hypothetical protein
MSQVICSSAHKCDDGFSMGIKTKSKFVCAGHKEAHDKTTRCKSSWCANVREAVRCIGVNTPTGRDILKALIDQEGQPEAKGEEQP